MSGAICGGSPYLWQTKPEPPRWCFGERKRQPGRWELHGAWPVGTIPMLEDGTPDPVMMWEPVWVYRCDGCGEDRALGFGQEWVWDEE